MIANLMPAFDSIVSLGAARILYHLGKKVSGNKKTGKIFVSTTGNLSCPPSCPFYKMGCYAKGGKLSMHWGKVSKGSRGVSFREFCAQIAALDANALWRHNQAGDLPGFGEVVDGVQLAALVQANKGKRGFTYTHKHALASNLPAIKEANANGFTVNLSANNLAHADTLADTKAGPVVVVLPSSQTANTVTPAGRKVVVCPATQRDDKWAKLVAGRKAVTCASCGLCAKANRSCIVGFPAHGFSARKAANASLAFVG